MATTTADELFSFQYSHDYNIYNNNNNKHCFTIMDDVNVDSRVRTGERIRFNDTFFSSSFSSWFYIG